MSYLTRIAHKSGVFFLPKPGTLDPCATFRPFSCTQWGRRGSPNTTDRFGPLLTNHSSATYDSRQSEGNFPTYK